jgi:pimeloyl-ACP methyl ester carboxylesterase
MDGASSKSEGKNMAETSELKARPAWVADALYPFGLVVLNSWFWLETWQAEFKNCAVHEFPNCGHFLAEEAPEAVAAHIRAFAGKRGAE